MSDEGGEDFEKGLHETVASMSRTLMLLARDEMREKEARDSKSSFGGRHDMSPRRESIINICARIF